MSKSIREQIVEYFVELFSDMTAELPVDDPYGVKFSIVRRGPIGKLQAGKISAMGIFDPSEEKNPKIHPQVDVRLLVQFEYHIYSTNVDTTSIELDKYQVAIERALAVDRTCNGLAYDVMVTRTDKDLDSTYDKQVSGLVEAEVKYRHRNGDPRKRVNE